MSRTGNRLQWIAPFAVLFAVVGCGSQDQTGQTEEAETNRSQQVAVAEAAGDEPAGAQGTVGDATASGNGASTDTAAAESSNSRSGGVEAGAVEAKPEEAKAPSTPSEWLAHAKAVREKRPRSDETELYAYVRRTEPELIKGLEQSLKAKDLDAETRQALVESKLEALQALSVAGEPGGAERMKEYVKELQSSDDPEIAQSARELDLVLRINATDISNPSDVKEAEQLAADMVRHVLEAPKITRMHQQFAMIATSIFETIGETKMAEHAYRQLAERYRRDGLNQFATSFEESAGRLAMIGQPAVLTGTQLTGEPIDLESYRGKVVLIDFWATWCPPCIAELPNVLQAYRDYHEKGFDVIGVSLDNDREALESFIQDREIPWTNLFETEAEKQAWNNPNVEHYSITGIPVAMLIDKDGKILTFSARGESLNKWLERLLGPASEESDATADEASES